MIPTREWAQTQTTTKNKLEFYKNSMKLVDLSFIIIITANTYYVAKSDKSKQNKWNISLMNNVFISNVWLCVKLCEII